MIDAGLRYQGSELALFADAIRWKRYYAKLLRPYLGPTVLEVGAGIGGTTRELCTGAHVRWVCLEPDATLVAQIDRRLLGGELPACCETRVGTLADVAQDERFDSVLYIDVLEHIEDDRGEIAQAALRLNRGGHLIVLAPAHRWLWSPFDASVGHHRRYTRSSLHALGANGTRIVSSRYLDAVGLFASLGNRLILRSAMPSASQIRVWDRWMVPLSQLVDPIFGYAVGKTVVAVWQRD